MLNIIFKIDWEEDLKYFKEPAKVATALCIKNTIYLWIRVSNKENWCQRWSSLPEFTQLIKNIRETISTSGTSDKELFMIESGPLISLSIKPRQQTRECGHLISPKQILINLGWSTTLTTYWQVSTIMHLSVMMSLKEDISIPTSIIWSSLCLPNCMMVWLNTMMAFHPAHLKWLMMFLSIWCTWLEARSLTPKLSCVLLDFWLQPSTP